MASRADDPIRADVERALQAVVDLTVRMPVRLMTAVPRCVVRRALRIGPLAEPARVVQSLLDLATTRSVATSDDAPAPPPPRRTIEVDADGDTARARPVSLPIEDFESLAASQVVDRLPTLTPDELRAVQAFEVANRSRRTVLGRIEQLLG